MFGASLLVAFALLLEPTVFPTLSKIRQYDSVLVDLENVRGKAQFRHSHQEILSTLKEWGQAMTVVVDHGSKPTSLYLPDNNMAILFSGPSRKADDVIVDVASTLATASSNHIICIITADQGLIERCERSVSKKRLKVVAPGWILEDLEKISAATTLVENHIATSNSSTVSLSSYELKIAADLLQTEALMRNRVLTKNKRRKKLKQKAQVLRDKLQDTVVMEYVERMLLDGTVGDALSPEDQQTLTAKWNQARATSMRKETTGDRVHLAEHFRQELVNQYGHLQNDTTTNILESPTQFLANKVQKEQREGWYFKKDTIRMVICSDTHGFEEDIPNVPDGDVLIHLGDFAVDGRGKKEALVKFDAWMAKQPHKAKIIVRGNHDPHEWLPIQSGAAFVKSPKTMMLGNLTLAIVPFANSGAIARFLPKKCDILATHVPPRNILDKCLTGGNAGSRTLRKCVEKMKAGPPALWICGHIHEARGSVQHVFCLDKETMVVNAAQANPGMAAKLDHGLTVIDVQKEGERKEAKVTLVDMPGQYVFMNQQQSSFFERKAEPGVLQLLLAVDLGLRTGVSLFSDEGKLIRYDNFDLSSVSELERKCHDILTSWEASSSTEHERKEITHIVIEGGDPPLREAWQSAAGSRAVINIKPSEWRQDLLLPQEQISGQASKEASRLIAKQVISDYGDLQHEGKINTDVAESIMIGLHISRRLGWIRREPAVRRFSNGTPIKVPSKSVEVDEVITV